MERKFADSEAILRTCKRVLIKSSPSRIVVHKRERGYRYLGENDPSESTIAIVYFYLGPDDVEEQSVRLLVIDGITYVLEALAPPS